MREDVREQANIDEQKERETNRDKQNKAHTDSVTPLRKQRDTAREDEKTGDEVSISFWKKDSSDAQPTHHKSQARNQIWNAYRFSRIFRFRVSLIP